MKTMNNFNEFNNDHSLQGKQLAELLDVAPASLSGASSKDHLCKGHPVAQWAQRNERGKLISYQIPESDYNKLTGTPEEPKEGILNEVPDSGYKSNKAPNQANETASEPLKPTPVVRSNPPVDGSDNITWTGALCALALGVGAMYLGNHIQNQNGSLSGQISGFQQTAPNPANNGLKNGRKRGGVVWV
jgi:hypothetical protein